jgi:hypothetical protein
VLLSRLLDHLVHNDKLVEMLGFIILPLPILISWALELFEAEEEDDEDEEEGEETEAESAEHGNAPDHHGGTALPVLVYAGAGPAGDGSAMQLVHAASRPDTEGFLETESARSRFREGQEARLEAKEHSGATGWKVWITRIAGVPLVVVSVYLVVTHIAGG